MVPVTDARLPERWLNDRRMARLSDGDWRAFTSVLMWSVSNRTDGVIHPEDVELIPRFDVDRAGRLVSADILVNLTEGWLINEFVTTQTTAKKLASADLARVRHRETQHRYTERKAAEHQEPAGQVEVTGQDTGQARPGQARIGRTTPAELQDSDQVQGCPGCGEDSNFSLVGTREGRRCRRCAAGIKSGTVCMSCDQPREVGRDGQCNSCRQSKAGAA